MVILLLVAAVVAVIVLLRYKRFQVGNLTLITGGVKKGKTQLAVALSIRRYKKHLRKWRWRCLLCKLTRKPVPEKPLYYTNMPVGKGRFEYSPITLSLIKREERFRYGSVVYFNEVSFLAGSKDIKDENINDTLLQLFKLCAHETKGGYFFIDTQSPQDMHYTIKRSLSTYLNIERRLTLPFVSLLWVRENMLVDGENTVAIQTDRDPQDGVLEGGKPSYFMLCSNGWWKWYDRYAYSSLTDHLPVAEQITRCSTHKVNGLVRLRKG